MTTIADLVAQAIQYHQAGNLQQAEMLYRQILHYEPRHADALHLLGVIAYQVGQYEAAVQYIRQALTLIPQFAAAHSNLGNALRGLGNLDEAAASLREALRLDPNYLEAYSNLGIVLREQGHIDQAAQLYRQALRIQPHSAMVHNNLGNALRDLGQQEEAVRCYEQALRLAPQYPEAFNNLGISLQELGQTQRAAVCFREAIRLRPDYAQAHNNLGVLLAGHGQPQEARACYERALQLQPDYADAHKNLGLLLHVDGKLAEATAQFQEALRLRPQDPTALHMVAALTGAATPVQSVPGYVESLFDGYADNFDDHLLKVLGYRGPQLLREAVAELAAPKALDILDLGCGTGLCGVVFKDWARTLTGVDLSAKMLAKARARGLYDQLIHGDLLIPLQAAAEAFDLLVAGDVLAYFGELGAVFQAASKALRPAGRLAFLVEAYEGEGEGEGEGEATGKDYVLRKSGRFAHSIAYLRRLAEGSAFTEVVLKKAVARTDGGKDIESLVCVYQRRSAVAVGSGLNEPGQSSRRDFV